MFSEEIIQSLVDGLVIFATDLLMPVMVVAFVVAVITRGLVYYTVKREEWFSKEFSKRVRKFMDTRDDSAPQSFYIACKRLLEITYYEIFEVRAILKRRNPDAIMTVTDRVFLVQQGAARLVIDTLRQIKYLKHGQERPKLLEISTNVFKNNPCFNKVFGIIPVSILNDILNIIPGLFIVGGIFGTFLGIMKALPELGGMNLNDIDGAKLIMDNFLLKISFSMSTSIIGIVLSVGMTLMNTFMSCEAVFMETVERYENELDILWNMSASNVLPAQVNNFDADRDPIEVLAEELITKELKVEIGFVNLKRPINKWWNRVGKKTTESEVTAEAEAPAQSDPVSESDKAA